MMNDDMLLSHLTFDSEQVIMKPLPDTDSDHLMKHSDKSSAGDMRSDILMMDQECSLTDDEPFDLSIFEAFA
jgi:hypothetical protein